MTRFRSRDELDHLLRALEGTHRPSLIRRMMTLSLGGLVSAFLLLVAAVTLQDGLRAPFSLVLTLFSPFIAFAGLFVGWLHWRAATGSYEFRQDTIAFFRPRSTQRWSIPVSQIASASLEYSRGGYTLELSGGGSIQLVQVYPSMRTALRRAEIL